MSSFSSSGCVAGSLPSVRSSRSLSAYQLAGKSRGGSTDQRYRRSDIGSPAHPGPFPLSILAPSNCGCVHRERYAGLLDSAHPQDATSRRPRLGSNGQLSRVPKCNCGHDRACAVVSVRRKTPAASDTSLGQTRPSSIIQSVVGRSAGIIVAAQLVYDHTPRGWAAAVPSPRQPRATLGVAASDVTAARLQTGRQRSKKSSRA
jgi:hypothetical protein